MSIPAYFRSLTLENLYCFKRRQKISFAKYNAPDEPAMFTVILGNNNMGKTTLLRCLGGLHIFEFYVYPYEIPINDESTYKIKLFNDFLLKKTKHEAQGIHNSALDEHQFFLNAYGINRKTGSNSISEYAIQTVQDRTATLFQENSPLLNTTLWIENLYGASQLDERVKGQFERVKQVVNNIFAAAEGIPREQSVLELAVENGKLQVLFKNTFGDSVKLNVLGSGYQSLITFVLDLAYRMFERYPQAENPLHEPAVVLVDELDLHLHPEWQRRVVHFLRELFPRTQFIVTAHSPLIVQSADNLNIIILKKNNITNDVDVIDANDLWHSATFEGWNVEEILRDLMLDDEEHLYSNRYLSTRKAFENAIADADIALAQATLEDLKKLINPNSVLAHRFTLRLNSLIADNE